MFFYLSFLRPPPLQVSPGTSITITPQIANDLRTELCSKSQDIYYSWSLTKSGNEVQAMPVAIGKPAKLTTWRESNAYKEINIPPPQGAREGQAYRLVLTSHDQGYPHVVNFAAVSTGERPFPVMSMPIIFGSRHNAFNTTKQEQVERVYRIPGIGRDQVFLTVKEQTSFDLDKKIWDSGIGLSSWLVALQSGTQELHNNPICQELLSMISLAHLDVIELGAGTGIVSLTIGALRSATQRTDLGGKIITTDLASAIPLLEHNISANDGLFLAASVRPKAVVLDWDDARLPDEVSTVQDGFELIVMADVTYNTASFPSLIHTLESVAYLGDPLAGKKKPMVLLGYKERDPAERTLWHMMESIGFKLERVGERPGAGGSPVEVWAARLGVSKR